MDDKIVKQLRSVVKSVVKEEINDALKPVKEILNKHTKILGKHTKILDDHTKILGSHTQILEKHTEKLDSLWEQTTKLTEDAGEIQVTLDHHTASLKRMEMGANGNKDNVVRLDKRVATIENRHGIVPPAEFSVIK